MTLSIEQVKKLSKRDHIEPWYARKIVRRISPYVTWSLLHTAITANQTTILMILVGIVASILFAMGGTLTTLIGALVLQLFYILDHVDGEIARCRNASSVTGIYLDRLANFIVNPLAFIAITIGLYQQFPSLPLLIFGLIASWSLVLRMLAGSTLSTAVGISIDKSLKDKVLDSVVAREDSETTQPVGEEIAPLVPAFVPGVLFNLVRKVLFLWIYPAVMNVITVAAILNVFFPRLQMGLFEFNFMYLVIMLYATTLPIMCALLISYHTAIRNADRLFVEIKRRITPTDIPLNRKGDKLH